MATNRYIKNTAILAKIETTYGTDAVPSGAVNAVLGKNLSAPQFDAQNVDRAVIRPYFGASEQLVGTANFKCSFDVELQNGGTPGTPPAWGPLLRACSAVEIVTAGAYVEYLPITDNAEAITLKWYDSGVVHTLLGARGTAVIKYPLGDAPSISYSFTGLHGGTVEAAVATSTLTGFKVPQVVTDANSGDITFGCTYAAGVLSGGQAYPSRGLELNLGNTVTHQPLLGQETVDVTDRTSTSTFQLNLTAAQEVAFMNGVVANSSQSFGFVHGTVAGKISMLYVPAIQLINPSKQEMNGKRLIGYDGRLLPITGNDEFRLVLK